MILLIIFIIMTKKKKEHILKFQIQLEISIN